MEPTARVGHVCSRLCHTVKANVNHRRRSAVLFLKGRWPGYKIPDTTDRTTSSRNDRLYYITHLSKLSFYKNKNTVSYAKVRSFVHIC
jgi:hypothetical protein